MRTIRKIGQGIPHVIKRKKVAAYARVSVESERMHHSLSAQVSYYSALIQQNPEWEYAGVYTDYGITGTSTKKRRDFQRMLEDAKDGKIDIILTKSIQRFARNTVDLLQSVRLLKEIGVEVWFEKENIHTMSGDGELMLTILASFAQEESRSISDNIKWRFRKKFEQGIPHARFFVYGYQWQGENLIIVPEEAKIVRKIYNDYLSGKTRKDIMRDLKKMGIRSMYGNFLQDASIKQFLTNRVYTGILEIQKTFIVDPITKRQVINRGEKDKYIVENHHEAIIDSSTFTKAQEELARRKEQGKVRGGYARDFLNTCCFTGVLKCGICGRSYVHIKRKYKGQVREYWGCESHKQRGKNCGAIGSIPQQVLENACVDALGLSTFSEDEVLQSIQKIIVPTYHTLVFYLANGEVITQKWESTALKDCWTDKLKCQQRAWMERYRQSGRSKRYHPFSGRIYCPICKTKFVRCRERSGNIYWRSKGKHKCVHVRGIQENKLECLVATLLDSHPFDGDLFRSKVSDIEIMEDGNVIFRMVDGKCERGRLQ